MRTHRHWNRVILPLAIIASTALGAHAGPIGIPPGLNPGDTYRILFVTSTTRDATSANIADYNAFVTNAADSVPALQALGATWYALASTASVNALQNAGLDRSDLTTPFYNTAGQLIAAGIVGHAIGGIFPPGDGLYDGALFRAAAIYDETGAPSSSGVWTGTDPLGQPSGLLGTTFVRVGAANNLGLDWTSFGADLSSAPHALYGISSPLTVPAAATPEPGTAALGLVGAVLVILGKIRKRSGVRGGHSTSS